MSIAHLLEDAVVRLRAGGIETPGMDARILLQHLLGTDHAGLISALREPVPPELPGALAPMVERRLRSEPVWRIIGWREFYGLRLRTGPDVLDPRPETEILVDHVLASCEKDQPYRFCDVGTGSGAIAVALLRNLPLSSGVGLDISTAALEIAEQNAQSCGVAERLALRQSDFLQAVDECFDFVVANPPYIATAAIDALAPEVRGFDPRIALDGGSDGLDAYRAIFAQAGARLKSFGRLYLEIGAEQAAACTEIARENGWEIRAVVRDLAGHDRVMEAARQRICA